MGATLGLYTTVREDTEGGKIVYSHDKPTLEESNYISVRSAAGYAWTNEGWNEGFPNWRYGIDVKGNAILNQIAAIGIDSEWIKTNSISVSKIESKGFVDLIAEKINLYGLVTFYGLDKEAQERISYGQDALDIINNNMDKWNLGENALDVLETITMIEDGVTSLPFGSVD